MKLNIFKKFTKEESGASMVEYGVALLVVTAIGVTAMSFLGDSVAANVATACDALDGVAGGCAATP